MFLENLVKWIKKDGVILLSTPNKYVTSPFTDKPLNKFHVLEYTEISLLDELNNYFYVEEILGQRIINKFYLNYLVRKFISIIQKIIKTNFRIYEDRSGPLVEVYNHLFL